MNGLLQSREHLPQPGKNLFTDKHFAIRVLHMSVAGGEKGCWAVGMLAALVGQRQTSRVELQDGVGYKDTVKGMLVRLLLDNEESINPTLLC